MDFRNFGTGGASEGRERIVRWWSNECEKSDVANAVSDSLEIMADQQADRVRLAARDARLYGNATALRLSGLPAFQMPGAGAPFAVERVTYNVVKSVIDTVVSRIGKNRPKPYFLTNGGDYREQKKAKKLNLFCDGLFYENSAHRMGVNALRDACVWGDGVIHIYVNDAGRVKWERVFPFEIFVDEVEGIHGEPRQMYRLKDVDRSVLLERFPGKKDIVEVAPSAGYDNALGKRVSDMVTVREAWHLPSKKGAKDGKHCISVANGLLTDVVPWKFDFFPFVRFGWSAPMAGYWSQGVAAETQGIQFEINKLLQTIQKSYHLGGTFKVLIEHGSKIVKEHVNNDIGAIISYTGKTPEYVTPPLVQPEIYGHLSTLIQRAYEQAGVSMMSATSQKPLGIESGKAMRTLNDIENDRFYTFGKNYENFYLDLADVSIALVAARGGEYKVKAPGRGSTREVDWKDIDLDRDAYVMECFPVSSLPSDPAGRLATIQEMMASGMMTPRRGRSLLNFPDLEAEENLANAAEEYLEMVLDLIVEDGIYTPPEPFDDLVLAKELALQYYAAGKTQGLDQERLADLRRFIEQAVALEAPPPAPPPPGMPPMPAEQTLAAPPPAQMPMQ